MRISTPLPFLTLSLCLALAVSGAQAQTRGCTEKGFMGSDSQVLGTLAGAALGGLLGSQVGGGTGKKVAIGAGVVAGGMLGNSIGSSMDCADQLRHSRTTQDALESQHTGQSSSWQNPDTQTAGSVTPTRTWTRDDGTPCRDFQQTITIEGRQETLSGTACRQNDGTWRTVEG